MEDILLDIDFQSQAFKETKKSSTQAQIKHVPTLVDKWFSSYLNLQCRLVFSPTQCQDTLIDNPGVDAHSILLINTSSIEQLNCRLKKPICVTQFHPHIVVQGDFPFVEDTWKRIRIGEVEFIVSKPCAHYPFINVDSKTGQAPTNESLQTLASFRYAQNEVHFGQYLIPLTQGKINVGDDIIVLETQYPAFYSAQNETNRQQEKSICIEYQPINTITKGNNQGLLLEQAEQAGIYIPHACRNGRCGQCRVQLISGDVIQLNDFALTTQQKEQGYILSCSCIPISDITINY
ncbi:YcbX family protein [Psychromonas sp. CD1]|uniref:YcbX family protein n=1 Tax=Psychromonas sp. CD1 TaxID=1979839 RepID=UPI0021517183|nr:2Fe-2S iron-sulfur cluster-binding protein [Psychromonas sp. CD1]